MFAQTMPDSPIEPKPLTRLVFRALKGLAGYLPAAVSATYNAQGGKTISALTLTLLCLFPAGPILAESADYERMIEQRITPILKKYAREQGWNISRIEFRHQLSQPSQPCPEPVKLSVEANEALARQRITISCPTLNWQLSATSQATLWLKAIYAAQGIERGTPLTRAHLQIGELEASRSLREFYQDPEALLGLAAKRRIRAKQLLSPTLLQAAKLISRSQQVTIIASQQGISASAQGVALSDGAEGEVIRVRNVKTQKVIDAKVYAKGEVLSLF